MTDETAQRLAALRGIKTLSYTSVLEEILRHFPAWLEGIAITEMEVYNRDFDPTQLAGEVNHAYTLAQKLLKDVPIGPRLPRGLVTALREFEVHAHYAHAGLFLSAVIDRCERGFHTLPPVNDLKWVGYGLENVILEAEQFGDMAGIFQQRVTFTDVVPSKMPKKGIVYVGKRFGSDAGHGSGEVIVDTGTFGDRTAEHAKVVVIHDGMFADHTAGYVEKKVVIDGGKFGKYTAEFANNVVIHGGTFEDRTCYNADYVVVHNGTFNSSDLNQSSILPARTLTIYGGYFACNAGVDIKSEGTIVGPCTWRVEYTGGDYADAPWESRTAIFPDGNGGSVIYMHTDTSGMTTRKIIGKGTFVRGRVEVYGDVGTDSKRYRIIPETLGQKLWRILF